MKITPLEIRQKTFEKKLRGYDKDEVSAFLLSLSQEWEQVQDELKELKIRQQNAEKEIKQLREVENSLFKTLKTAEDTGANMIDQATKTAELHLRETQMNADALLNEAKAKARATIEDSETRARHVLDKMEGELKVLSMEYRGLENLRDIIIAELRNISNDTLQRVEKMAAKAKKVDLSHKEYYTDKNIKENETAPVPEVNSETQAEEEEADSPANEPLADTLTPENEIATEPGEDQASSAVETNAENTEEVGTTDDESEESSFFDQIK
jgi:cell division initiation protein